MTGENVTEYRIPYGRYPIKAALIVFFSVLLGAVLVYPLTGLGSFLLGFPLGSISAVAILLFSWIWNPYKLSIEQDGVRLFFRLRPSKYLFFFEIKEVFFNTTLNQPVMQLNGRGFIHSLSPDAARHLLTAMKSESQQAKNG